MSAFSAKGNCGTSCAAAVLLTRPGRSRRRPEGRTFPRRPAPGRRRVPLLCPQRQYGHLYIANRLRRRGLPVPEDVERPDEYALAQALAGRKFSYRADEARKAARFLQYRAFRRLS